MIFFLSRDTVIAGTIFVAACVLVLGVWKKVKG